MPKGKNNTVIKYNKKEPIKRAVSQRQCRILNTWQLLTLYMQPDNALDQQNILPS